MSDAEAAEQKEEMMEKIYSMYWRHDGENAPDARPIDGDFKMVFPTGYEFNRVTQSVKIDDMPRLRKSWGYQGVAVDLTHVPTKVLFKSNGYELPGILQCSNWFVVSSEFRQVVEGLEPGKHQFSAVELVDEAGMHVADYFWFNPCARIDSMDREHTTFSMSKTGVWEPHKSSGKYVISLKQIMGAQIWIDPVTGSSQSVYVTHAFREAMSVHDVTGIGYFEREAI